ncbi:unnamed protein product, partial [Mesorhabditis belari]|uniref:Uncharacterized protein n=1 Tax=Mesorhabditis belari TaxID=2138241 RepID=A0AAF3FHI6_9BILA
MDDEKLLNDEKKKKESPELHANLFSKIFFCWLAPLFAAAKNNEYDKSKVFPILPDFKNEIVYEKWLNVWGEQVDKAQMKKTTPKTFWMMFNFAKAEWIKMFAVRSIADIFQYIQPLLFTELLTALGAPVIDVEWCLIVSILMFFMAELRSFCLSFLLFRLLKVEIKLKAAVVRHIYEKGTRLSPTSQQKFPVGAIVNLMSVDIERLVHVIPFVHHFWAAPLQLIFATLLLIKTIGISAIPGILIILCYVPFNYYTSVYMKKFHKKKMRSSDQRLKQLEETVSGIETVKTHVWENAFSNRIEESRNNEVRMLKNASCIARAVDAANMALPVIVAVTSFGAFVLFETSDLTPTKAFVSLAIFNKLRQPARIIAQFLNGLMQALVANKRIKEYLLAEERNAGESRYVIDDKTPTLQISTKLSTKPLNLILKRGDFASVVGAVSSGKSTLLNRVLWNDSSEYNIKVNGRIAYVPQKPWLPRGSVKNAIIFGLPWDEKHYIKVVDACELKTDFEQWANGDQTMIVGMSNSLSGGQRARLSLARALYQRAELYLIDDTFASLDRKVGSKVMKNILGSNGILKNSAVMMVSSDVDFGKEAKEILVLSEHKVIATGQYKELSECSQAFKDLLSYTGSERTKNKAADDEKPRSPSKSSTKSAFEDEKVKPDNNRPASWSVYKAYIDSASKVFIFGLFTATAAHFILGALRSFWLSNWSDAAKNKTERALETEEETAIRKANAQNRLFVFAGIGALEVIAIAIAYVFLVLMAERASKVFHKKFVVSLLNASMTVHRKIDVGQVMNRASRDCNIFDNRTPLCLRQMIQNTIQIVCSLAVVAISTPSFLFALGPIAIGYIYIQNKYIPTMKQWSRIERAQWSPVITQATEGMAGVEVIRSAAQEARFSEQFVSEMEDYVRADYLENPMKRWLMLRLDIIGNSITLCSSLLCVWSISNGNLTPGVAGLSISFAMTVTEQLGHLVRMVAEMETSMIAVERIKKYVDLEPEDSQAHENAEKERLLSGDVEWKDYYGSYRKNGTPVLHGITMRIPAGERVVIVGRTGSGKSSTFLSLLGMLEKCGGEIDINGISTSNISVKKLRKHCAVVPQSVRIFDDSVRFNIDPERKHDDIELWKVLERSGLKALISWKDGLDERLCADIMSHGQRQLLGVSRSLLSGGENFQGCLLLDEPFASADSAVMANLEQVIPKWFSRATVFTITHKPPADGTYDRLIEISNGEIVAQHVTSQENAQSE